MAKIIPLSALRGACKDQLRLVRKHWPKGVPVTATAMRLAVKLGLDFDWAAVRLLRATALTEYEKAKATAWAEYEKATAPAWAEYKKTTALTEYKKATATAWAEYQKVKATALLALLRRHR